GPLRPRPVTKAFSRRANHQFTLVVLIVSVLAFIGGSFFPIGNLSNFFRILGNYTPNGAAMTAFLELLKGNEGLDIWQHVFVLIGFAVLFLGISIGMYPKRGQLL